MVPPPVEMAQFEIGALDIPDGTMRQERACGNTKKFAV